MPAIRPIAQTNVGSLCGSFGNRQGRNASSLMVTNSARSSSSVIARHLPQDPRARIQRCAGSSTPVGFSTYPGQMPDFMHGGDHVVPTSVRRYLMPFYSGKLPIRLHLVQDRAYIAAHAGGSQLPKERRRDRPRRQSAGDQLVRDKLVNVTGIWLLND
jgi:hypothetical protein